MAERVRRNLSKKTMDGPGVVRYVTKKGISLEYDTNRRPVGTSTGTPDVNRANKEVNDRYEEIFNSAKQINRNSVYASNNSGKSGNGTQQG